MSTSQGLWHQQLPCCNKMLSGFCGPSQAWIIFAEARADKYGRPDGLWYFKRKEEFILTVHLEMAHLSRSSDR